MIVHVTAAALKAALLQAGKQDIRYYLNGICVEAYEKETRIIATDGPICSLLNSQTVVTVRRTL